MKTTPRARGRAALAALAALTSLLGASACQDPLVDPAVISGPRVIGARVHSEQDPSLAEPSPGGLLMPNQSLLYTGRVHACTQLPAMMHVARLTPGQTQWSSRTMAAGNWTACRRVCGRCRRCSRR